MTSRIFNSLSLFVVFTGSLAWQSADASTWTGGSGSWSSNGSPGWNGTGVPNAVGDIASKTDSTTATITQDIGAGVTIGTFTLGGASGNAVFQLNPTNAITLNNGGSGATISNTNSGTGTTRIAIGTGTLTLADSLLISNSSGSTNSTAISITSTIGGTGNVTFSNVSNSLSSGAIVIGGTNTFSGTVLIQKGAVTYGSTSTGLGNSSNAITLGSSGQGSASLISTASGSAATLANNITVASGSGGTLLIGSTGIGAVNATYSGTVLLNGNLSVTSVKPSGNDVRFTNVISGAGSLRTEGTGAISLRGINTYTGNTVLNGGQFTLADNAGMKFVIGASGVNNSVSGLANQTAIFDGDFTFDLSGAASSGTWTIVDVSSLAETFSGTFQVDGFTQASDIWTLVSGGTTYTFTEATGVLTAVPEPSTWALLAGGLVMLSGLNAMRRRRNG